MLVRRGAVIWMVVVLALLSVPAFAVQAVTDIRVTDQPDRVDVSVRALHPLTLSPFSSAKGGWVGFEVAGKCIVKSSKKTINSGGIYCIRYGAYSANPPKTRIVATTTAPIDYSTKKSPDGHGVTISLWKSGHKPKAATLEPANVSLGRDCGSSSVSRAEPADLPKPQPRPVVVASRTLDVVPRPVEVARIAEPPAVGPQKNISLDFIAADINDVLKALAVQTGSNIVSSSEVKGDVTVSLNKVGLEEALDYVTKLSGFSYAKSGETYVVGSARGVGNVTGNPADSGIKTDAIAIRFADVKELSKMLEQMVPGLKTSVGEKPEGAEGAPKGPTVLAFTGPADILATARQIAQNVEASFEADLAGRTIKTYEIKYARATELAQSVSELMPQVSIGFGPSEGFDLKGPGAVTLTQNLGASVADPVQNAPIAPRPKVLLVSGNPSDVDRAIQLLGSLDVRAPQIKIEAKVTDVSLNAQKNLGITWEWSTLGWTQATKSVDVMGVEQSVESVFHHLPASVNATINAMIAKGDANLLANPSIVALEGKPATFFVGDEFKYIIGIQNTPTGQNITTETANVGIQLRIVGAVSPDGEITLHLHPEVSVISDLIKIGTGGGTAGTTEIVLPQITRRFTDSVVRVKDGETLVIGGLIRENEINNLKKIPILGDLPILGGLFRNNDRQKTRSEIVIFLTASLIRE